ncbi:MAG: hypothetical protein JSS34_03900 [Proteobacteria bacterium]|nr:hypothetical protein [Pseudomonadota bacterium]
MDDFFEKAKGAFGTAQRAFRRWTSEPELRTHNALYFEENSDGYTHVSTKTDRRASASSSPQHMMPLSSTHPQSYHSRGGESSYRPPSVRPSPYTSHENLSFPAQKGASASPRGMSSQRSSAHPPAFLGERDSASSIPAAARAMGPSPSHSSSIPSSPFPQDPYFSPSQGDQAHSSKERTSPKVSPSPTAPRDSDARRSLLFQGKDFDARVPPAPSLPQTSQILPNALEDPFKLWTFSREELGLLTDTLPSYQRDIHANLPTAHEWILKLIPTEKDTATAGAEFDNLCADIIKIKRNIQGKEKKRLTFEVLINRNRTYALLYSLFSFQYMAWMGKDGVPVTQSYKNVVHTIWKTLTIDRGISLSSKWSILNYLRFLAESTSIHAPFKSVSDSIFRNSHDCPSSNQPMVSSFYLARKPHSLEIDLTIIKRCLRREDDAFQSRFYLCRSKFRDLVEDTKSRHAFFNNLAYFQKNSMGEFSDEFQSTYLYLYALVNYETFHLTNALDRASNKLQNDLLLQLYNLYKSSHDFLCDFYISLLLLQQREFPSHTIHTLFDHIRSLMDSKKEDMARASHSSKASPATKTGSLRPRSQSLDLSAKKGEGDS